MLQSFFRIIHLLSMLIAKPSLFLSQQCNAWTHPADNWTASQWNVPWQRPAVLVWSIQTSYLPPSSTTSLEIHPPLISTLYTSKICFISSAAVRYLGYVRLYENIFTFFMQFLLTNVLRKSIGDFLTFLKFFLSPFFISYLCYNYIKSKKGKY